MSKRIFEKGPELNERMETLNIELEQLSIMEDDYEEHLELISVFENDVLKVSNDILNFINTSGEIDESKVFKDFVSMINKVKSDKKTYERLSSKEFYNRDNIVDVIGKAHKKSHQEIQYDYKHASILTEDAPKIR